MVSIGDNTFYVYSWGWTHDGRRKWNVMVHDDEVGTIILPDWVDTDDVNLLAMWCFKYDQDPDEGVNPYSWDVPLDPWEPEPSPLS
jgi:hypothetical protein